MMADGVNLDTTAVNKISQKLAGNDLRTRNYALKKLKHLLERSSCSDRGLICDINLMRLWKGLHFCMWMADKPLFQEELAEKLSLLVHAFRKPEQSLQFISAFLKIEALEWHLLDFFRLDKFMMLVRKVLIQGLVLLKTHNWDSSLTKQFVTIVDDVLKADVSLSFVTHVLNVLKDELKCLLDGKLSEEDSWMQLFTELYRKRNQKLIPDPGAKVQKKSIFSAVQCAKALEEAVSEKDIEAAANRLLQFENDVIICRQKRLKSRKRKREPEEEDVDLVELNGDISSGEEDMIVHDGDDDGNDDDDDISLEMSNNVSDDDVETENSSMLSDDITEDEEQPVPIKPPSKKKSNLYGRNQALKNFRKKKILERKSGKGPKVAPKTHKPKKQCKAKDMPKKRAKASDFF